MSELNDWGGRIKQLREGRNLSQKAFAEVLQVGVSTVQRWEGGSHAPDLRDLIAISEATGRSVQWIATGDDIRSEPFESLPVGESGRSDFPGIPVVTEIPAGQIAEVWANEHPEEFVPLDPLKLTKGRRDLLFGMRVRGDSMEPWMYDGDVVICSNDRKPAVGDDVCLYNFRKGGGTVKRLEGWDKRTGRVKLRPLNVLQRSFVEEYRPPKDQMLKVIAIWRDYDDAPSYFGMF